VVTRAKTPEVRQELEQAGFAGSRPLLGDEAAETLDAKGERGGLLDKLVKSVQDHLSEQPDYLAQYEAEAREGNVVLAVPVDERERAEAVKDVLQRHGARNIRYFGKLAVSDLTPTSNPTPRTDAGTGTSL
jgi:hypothetical protein